MFKRILGYRKNVRLLFKKITNYLSFHSEDMSNLIKRMNAVFDRHDVKMTYFISTFLVEQRPSICSAFESHDFGPHGHYHVNVAQAGRRAAWNEIKEAVRVFKTHGFDPWVYRAPYARHIIENDPNLFFEFEKKNGILRDSSINVGPPPWENPLKPIKHDCGVITIPLIGVADDGLIDNEGIFDNRLLVKRFYNAFDQGRTGIIVYDLHPIRMGQARFINVVEALIKRLKTEKNVRIISLRDAFEQFDKKAEEETLVCFTGDIDNLSIFDYARRLVH
ncbi:MAG: polysaccharide deacetylase family protein [Candidatus Helarchaeota archaeon]